ncbi:DUF28-domain-containing protein [Wallemia mellicola CBS 633.66]|uniref:DUF28-domain-containing protein n=2 Tax=Wallemia mellicola TaxID=1708541 RepID=I4YHY8_WALMC|nr:DUF28-domain-containing protein [Wallemia mellicola CBS 633.66]TIB74166.1 hypothetical protein E3Q24_00731 [Wallemia mellicola]EIM23580.1 DUF28-domain-containing protein [Wallemia mellicola CBS 633.66]TIB90462.1 DUF28-domain-containing protein [Wallemia mellicola]TIB92140.1 DUF28-domain-containing protein [Wallemia mellicola]TIC19897.1 DUF28-domain-containing protein [Wallemia mellicola]|eukprot:XP_006956254.1 DUF28-domain-containing protein [Wallemia mellicola CBS 633.66]
MISRIFRQTRSFSSTNALPSGHNKWSKIRHHKGAADKARSKVFAKMALDISAAVKLGGGATDPALNARLSNALAKARSLSVPKDNIEAAIKRGDAGAVDKGHSVTYEALLADVGLIIECQTANVTRCNHSVKTILAKHGGRMASCGYLFSRKGVINLELQDSASFDTLFEDSIDAGGEDIVQKDHNLVEIITDPSQLTRVAESLIEKGYTLSSYDLAYIPVSGERQEIDDEIRETLTNLIDTLEEDSDAVDVHTNSTL